MSVQEWDPARHAVWSDEDSPENVCAIYTEHGVPAHVVDGRIVLRLGRESGLTAAHGPAEVAGEVAEVRDSWAFLDEESMTTLYRHPDANVNSTTVTVMHGGVKVKFEVLGDGADIELPGSTSSARWSPTNTLAPLPLRFRKAASQTTLLRAVPLTPQRRARQAIAGGLVRPNEMALVYGADGVEVSEVILAAMAEAVRGGAGTGLLLDYGGLGQGEVEHQLARLGVGNGQVAYVSGKEVFGSAADLHHLLTPSTCVLVLDSIPGLCRAMGKSDKFAEHVVPSMEQLASLALDQGIAVICADRLGREGRPRGAREKLDLCSIAWKVKAMVGQPGNRVYQLATARDRAREFSDRYLTVRAHDDGNVSMEWNHAVEAEEELRRAEVAKRLLEHVREAPGTLTPSGLSKAAELGPGRDLRREVIKELLDHGLLRKVDAPRDERGVIRRRGVLVLVDAQP